MRRRETANRNELGVSVVELAIVIPLLLGLVFASLEFARALRVSKMVSTMSREAANYAMRECSPVWDSPQPCLQDAVNKVQNFAAAGLGNVRVIVTLYKWNDTTSSPEEAGIFPTRADQILQASVPGVDAKRVTRFCLFGCLPSEQAIDQTLIRDAGMVTVGEVYVDYKPIVSYVPQIFKWNVDTLYEATIF